MQAHMSVLGRKAVHNVKPFSAAASGAVQQRRCVVVRSTGWADKQQNIAEKAMWGEDFGARDPTAAEIGSNFGDKTLGNWDTNHIVKIPAGVKKFVGIAAQEIKPVSELTRMEGKELDLYKNQVPGWRVVSSAEGHDTIRQEWKGKDAAAAAEIAKQLSAVAGDHAPVAVRVEGDTATVELSTPAVGGLTVNDFIVASRMNDTNVKDLIAKKKARFWA